MADIGNVIKLNEKQRIYYFPGGDKVVLNDIIELVVRESGTHRIKTADNKLHIIPDTWIHIEINASDWTV